MATLRAHFDGKAFTPLDPAPFAAGRVYEIDVREPDGPPRGSVQALLRAMDQPPHLSEEDVAELERAIESGKLPVRDGNIFAEDQGRGT